MPAAVAHACRAGMCGGRRAAAVCGCAAAATKRRAVAEALRRAGFHLDQHAFGAAFAAFDPDRNGTLGTPEYVALSVFCKNTAAMFHAFDSQRSGRVGLDYNQFVYAAANCK